MTTMRHCSRWAQLSCFSDLFATVCLILPLNFFLATVACVLNRKSNKLNNNVSIWSPHLCPLATLCSRISYWELCSFHLYLNNILTWFVYSSWYIDLRSSSKQIMFYFINWLLFDWYDNDHFLTCADRLCNFWKLEKEKKCLTMPWPPIL